MATDQNYTTAAAARHYYTLRPYSNTESGYRILCYITNTQEGSHYFEDGDDGDGDFKKSRNGGKNLIPK